MTTLMYISIIVKIFLYLSFNIFSVFLITLANNSIEIFMILVPYCISSCGTLYYLKEFDYKFKLHNGLK